MSNCHSRLDVIFISGTELPRVIPYKDGVPAPDPEKGQMLQYYSCPSHADEDYKSWCDIMIAREITSKEQVPKKKSLLAILIQ